jgi:hypothetical protein
MDLSIRNNRDLIVVLGLTDILQRRSLQDSVDIYFVRSEMRHPILIRSVNEAMV